MKALILHANRYGAEGESSSERIGETPPDELLLDDTGEGSPRPERTLFVEHMEECLVVLFQVEQGDCERQVKRLCKDVKKVADKVGTRRLMLGAFGHLSHKWPADPSVSKEIARQVVETCKAWIEYEVQSSHFGYNKTLLLDVKGHPDALKHRSYE